MSHFTVAVFHKKDESVVDIMAAYDECEPVVFVSASEELNDEYEENNSIDAYRLPNGKLVPEYDESLYVDISQEEYERETQHGYRYKQYKKTEDSGNTLYRKYEPNFLGATPCEVTLQELYPTLGDYIDSFCEWDVKNGVKGYWYNPNSKFDWCVIGGRWNGLLRLKPGKVGEMGVDGAFMNITKESDPPEGRCSSARVGDIDFSPNQREYDYAYRFWEVFIENKPLQENEKEDDFLCFYSKEYLKRRYENAENYAKTRSSFTTYAVVKDGKWYEPGSMGWFGIPNANVDTERQWDENYHKFIDEADENDILTIVDCHC